MVGRTISHYRILEKLGEGGMGVVYKARDTRLDRLVALKVLPEDALGHPQRRVRFIQEARAASALNHPNIVAVYDIDNSDGVQFISMEYVPGKTLDRTIGSKRLPVADVLKYAFEIADALARAHSAGIVHRDLKPSNIIVGEDGRVRLLDFGLAKLMEPESGEGGETLTAQRQPPVTEEGAVVGTVAYMSPEQAEGRQVDGRTDVFSFGAVLYEMLTGQRAFQRESRASTLAAVLKEDPKPAGLMADGIPHPLDRLIQRCLQKDPARRWQHMSDVKIALEDLKEDSASGAAVPAAIRPPVRPRVRWAAIAAGAILAGLAIAAWLWRDREEGMTELFSVPLTSDPGIERHPTLSPDGNQAAFSWNGDKQDNFDIYVRMIGAETSVRLTTDPANDSAPAWSPDGRSIAFARALSGGRFGLFLIAAIGGPERKLTEAQAGETTHVTWFPDNRHLVIPDVESPGEPPGLFLFSAETRDKRRLTHPPSGSRGDSDPAVSPNGRAVAFVRYQAPGVGDIHWVHLDAGITATGEPVRITSGRRITGRPVWTADGRELIYSAGRSAADLSLWRVNVGSPGSARRLPTGGHNCRDPVICHSRRRLVYARREYDVNIWRAELPRPGQPAAAPAQILSSTRPDYVAQFSPDGTKIVFHSDRSGGSEIWMSNADGSSPIQLTSLKAPISGSPRWSPDGRRIAFDSNAEGQFEVYVMDADGGGLRRRTAHPADDAVASWSRDGRWIYFGSNRTGKWQIWKMPAESGEPVQVTKDGGYVAFESADGRLVYYSKGSGGSSLWQVPVEGGDEKRVLDSIIWLNFVPVADGIYFMPASKPGLRTPIAFFGFADRKVHEVGWVERPPAFGLSISPDRRWVLFSQLDRNESDLMLVENFR